MISYAAVLALKLFPFAPRIRDRAMQLKCAGTTPLPFHRFRIAARLGQHLLVILRARASALEDAVSIPEHLGRDVTNSTSSLEALSDTSVENPLVSNYETIRKSAVV